MSATLKNYLIIILVGSAIIWGLSEYFLHRQAKAIYQENETSRKQIMADNLKAQAKYEQQMAQYRADTKAQYERLLQEKQQVKVVTVKADAQEQEYRNNPSLALANQVIDSKNQVILEQQDVIATQDSIILTKDRAIAAKDTLLDQNYATITDLNTSLQKANLDLKRAMSIRKRFSVVAGPAALITTKGNINVGAGITAGFVIW
jgi:hypothetical protein